MLSAWGSQVYRWRWGVLLVSGASLVLAVALLIRGGHLTSGRIEGLESGVAQELLERELGRPGSSSFLFIFEDIDPATLRETLGRVLGPLRQDPRVRSVLSADDVPTTFVLGTFRALVRPGAKPIPNPFISASGNQAVAIVTLRDEFPVAIKIYPELVAKLAAVKATFTGHLAFMHDLDATLEKDLLRAEAVSLPLSMLVLLLVFSTLVAAAVPVGVGALAGVGGVAAVNALSHVIDLAQYTINDVTLIGRHWCRN